MAGQNQAPSMDLFDSYFRRADLDQDGRISGAEAVAFLQGSNLPNQVLAKIWMHADQSRAGFLGRAEFYNALKLVTVAQSKRELTPDIVKAALFGPAAAKIPAPQINLAATPAPQLNSMAATPAPQMGALAPTASQNLGFRGPQGVSGQRLPGGGTVAGPRPSNSNVSNDWLSGTMGGTPVGASSQAPVRGITPNVSQDGLGLAPSGLTSSILHRPQANSVITPSVASKPQDQVLPSFQSAAKNSNASIVSGNGSASDSIFGGDVFFATPFQAKKNAEAPTFSAGSAPVSFTIVPASTGPQPSVKQGPLDSSQSLFTIKPVGGQLQQAQSLVPNQQISSQSQLPWPRMTQSDVQKYTKVFVEVDTDRDGKITGEQARNLFLSWRLPREVLKQVWDLSDQDNDSMLSLREFCTALYLMERFREGRPLPALLPSSIMFDEPTIGQPTVAYGNTVWRPSAGIPGTWPVMPAATARPPAQVPVPSQADGVMQPNQQKSRVPVLEKHLVNQLSKEEQNSLNLKFQEATEADRKVEELEKEILDSKEKIESYRSRMQDLVLYKSKCDNRLNEITERASADKREVESLAKKYEEKCKQVGDIASKLSIEEATFRDIQERKMELYQAIVKMEQGGSAAGILQVRADRIQSDLEELVKNLNERCKKYGLLVKPTAVTALPFGWQGIQEGAVAWDEDWDKFEDEGFTFFKELTIDVQNAVVPAKPKSNSVWKEEAFLDEGLTTVSSSNADIKSDKLTSIGDQITESGSAYAQSEDGSARSPPGSPAGRSALESSSQEFPDTHFGKKSRADASPRSNENQSDHGGAESMFSADKSFDEPNWGTFDTNDDADSVWGFNPVHTKDLDHERHRENSFFSGDLSLNPVRTDSPQADSIFQKKSPFSFGDSVPGSPLFNSGNSPPRYGERSEEPSFDNFSRFDSFSMQDTGFFPPHEGLTRFDSIRSTRDFDHSRGFPSFDDTDPFGSTGPFKTISDSRTPRRDSDKWSAF